MSIITMSFLNLPNDIWNEIVLYIDIWEWDAIETLASIKIYKLTKNNKIKQLKKKQGCKYFEESESLETIRGSDWAFDNIYDPSEEVGLGNLGPFLEL